MSTTANTSILAKICADKLVHISSQKTKISPQQIEEMALASKPCKGFYNAINSKTSQKKNALIAEVKKASPSKGIIRADFNPEKIAVAYENGGASCISVLTDTPYFQGVDEYLRIVRKACSLPLLRKDFMLDTYQVFEARALGADCILLIMAALGDSQASELESAASALGMDILIEVHDEEELKRALKLESKLIGINNRNLKTLAVDLATTSRLASMIPSGYTIVCESGISTKEDIAKVNESGVYSFLVGESLMVQGDVEEATKKLLS